MAGVIRTNGQVEAGSFIGYPLTMVKAAATGGFLAATQATDASEIVEKGYDKAVKAIEMIGSVLWVSEQDDDGITVMVEGNTFPLTADDITALEAALQAIVDAGTAVVTTSTTLNGDGTFTYA